MSDFEKEVTERIDVTASNQSLQESAHEFLLSSIEARYSYNFS